MTFAFFFLRARDVVLMQSAPVPFGTHGIYISHCHYSVQQSKNKNKNKKTFVSPRVGN